MSQIIETVDVDVPVRVAYDQWTQFEEFPRFMKAVEKVEQLNDTTIRWTAEIAGVTKTWTAIEGAKNAGVVTFHRLDDRKTRVTLQLDVEPEGPVESAGDALGFVSRQAKDDLKNFKTFIEQQGVASGAWRGEVRQDDVTG
jgi:uncharacterized membrane protein